MIYLKTGLIISTLITLLSMIFITYDILEVRTIVDLFIIPAFIINGSLLFKVFRNKNVLPSK